MLDTLCLHYQTKCLSTVYVCSVYMCVYICAYMCVHMCVYTCVLCTCVYTLVKCLSSCCTLKFHFSFAM